MLIQWAVTGYVLKRAAQTVHQTLQYRCCGALDLENVIKGKPAPLVDQYENHCRVDRTTPAGDGLVLTTTCFEFWDDYTKGTNGQKVTIRLSPGPKGTIRIDGKAYLLCNHNSDLPKNR